MRPEQREALRRQFQHRCGYSGVSEDAVGAELTVDHFQPRSQGGLDEEENWVYCCHACNEFKGDVWQPASAHRILHPLRDDFAAHLALQDDGTLLALTETGTYHIDGLHLNRRQLVAYRRERRLLDAARLRQAELLNRLQELEEHVRTLTDQLEQLGRGEATK
jgi:hypothetical protein